MADIAAVNWNEVDASNTAAAPDGAVEGMAPSGVNNVLRAHQGAIKRFWKRNSVMATTGTAGAFLVTHTVPPTALADGETELVSFHVANTAGATLNVGGLGDKPLHYFAAGAWRLVPAGLWGADQTLKVAYHASSSAYRLIDLHDRTGEVTAFAGATAPAGSLFCFGQAVSRTDYAGLFAALSTAHGVGDGSSTFNVPDLRGRVTAGKGDMGGSESGRLNGQVASVLGAAGGAQSHTLTTAELAQHAHNITDNAHDHNPLGGGSHYFHGSEGTLLWSVDAATVPAFNIFGRTATNSRNAGIGGTHNAGSNGAHNNVQPTLALNYVIRI